MIVLVVNCGSSSLKYQLVNMDNEEVMAKGLVEKSGFPIPCLPINGMGRKGNPTVHPGSQGSRKARIGYPDRR